MCRSPPLGILTRNASRQGVGSGCPCHVEGPHARCSPGVCAPQRPRPPPQASPRYAPCANAAGIEIGSGKARIDSSNSGATTRGKVGVQELRGCGIRRFGTGCAAWRRGFTSLRRATQTPSISRMTTIDSAGFGAGIRGCYTLAGCLNQAGVPPRHLLALARVLLAVPNQALRIAKAR